MKARRLVAFAVALAVLFTGCSDDDGAGGGARVERSAGQWHTWVLTSASEVSVPPPPRGQQAEAEAAEVHDLVAHRTPEIDAKIRQWGQAPANKPWHDLNLELVAAGVKDPPLASRGYSLTSVAISDAVVATWHWKYVYDRRRPAGVTPVSEPGPYPSYPSEHAAVAGAAARVMTYLFPERPEARFEALADEAALSRVQAGTNFRSDVEAGLALGRAVADKVIARAQTDGILAEWDGTRPPGIGGGPQFWEPPPGRVAPPTQPLAGTWSTWVLTSGSQIRPRPPHAYGSPEHLAECREVMDVKAHMSPEQQAIASFWAGGQGTALPPGLWNQIAMTYVQAAGLSTPRAARAMALLNVAQSDIGVAVWDAKFTYWSPRPQNAIRDTGLDPAWDPYIPTPPFPSYVSGHSGYSAAAAEVLGYLFPEARDEFRAKAEESALSRLYGGIHYRSDNEVGLEMGRQVGRLVVEHAKEDGSDD